MSPLQLKALAGLVLAAGCLLAQRAMSTAEVLSFVRSQIKIGDDRSTADYLRKIKLTQRLDEKTVEQLQGEGAGPQTVRALHKLAGDSAALSAPPPVVAKAPAPPQIPPDSIEQANALAAIREYALHYTASLPNYVCVQTTHRKIEPAPEAFAKGYRGTGNQVQELLTFYDRKESYKVEMIDGKAVKLVEHNQLGGTISSGEFGTMLAHIFDPKTGTEFDWDHWGTWDGTKNLYVFSYRVPQAAGYSMLHVESHSEYTSAYKGLIYADHNTKAILHLTLDTVGVPPSFPIHEVHIALTYAATKIADQEYILPSRYLLTSKIDNATTENQADFKLYRKYGAESSITFEPIPDEPGRK
jgi:hypothetical protein